MALFLEQAASRQRADFGTAEAFERSTRRSRYSPPAAAVLIRISLEGWLEWRVA
jgi:hypothetical protein